MVKTQDESSKILLEKIEKLDADIEDREKLIIKQELELTDLRISVEKKDEVINAQNKHIEALNLHLKTKDNTIDILRDIIYKKFKIRYLKTEDLHKELQEPTEQKVKELITKAEKQQVFIDQYRNSIVFPLYKITHSLGKTKIGAILQKLIK